MYEKSLDALLLAVGCSFVDKQGKSSGMAPKSSCSYKCLEQTIFFAIYISRNVGIYLTNSTRDKFP